MRVERQMGTVHREIIFNQPPQQLVTLAGPGMRWSPEQSVVHNEQVCVGGDREFDRRAARVHGGGDAANRAAIFPLQSVHRAVVVADFPRLQQLIAMTDNRGERSVLHGCMEPERRSRATGILRESGNPLNSFAESWVQLTDGERSVLHGCMEPERRSRATGILRES